MANTTMHQSPKDGSVVIRGNGHFSLDGNEPFRGDDNTEVVIKLTKDEIKNMYEHVFPKQDVPLAATNTDYKELKKAAAMEEDSKVVEKSETIDPEVTKNDQSTTG